MDAEKKEKTEKVDVSGEGEEEKVQMVAGDMKIRVKRLAANGRRDARATAKLESSSDSVTEKIIETSMGHVNNPSACITNAVDGETREETNAWQNETIGRTWEGEPVPE